MKLGKIKSNDFPEKQVQNKRNEPLDRSKYRINFESFIPYGKYKNRTLQWIHDNDDWYYNWIASENLFISWGLVSELHPNKNKKESTFFVTESNERWFGLREVVESCEPSMYL